IVLSVNAPSPPSIYTPSLHDALPIFPVTIGHLPESVRGADCVIRTAAVHDDNPEIAAARAAGIPVFERAEAWGAIMRHYQNALCVAGTHGKTTTTSMCTQIFLAAQRDPTVMIGGTLPALGAGHRVGKGDTIILESCEYGNRSAGRRVGEGRRSTERATH